MNQNIDDVFLKMQKASQETFYKHENRNCLKYVLNNFTLNQIIDGVQKNVSYNFRQRWTNQFCGISVEVNDNLPDYTFELTFKNKLVEL